MDRLPDLAPPPVAVAAVLDTFGVLLPPGVEPLAH